MPNILGTRAVVSSNSTDPIEFDAGVIPGIRAADAYASLGMLTFSLGTLGASLVAGTSQTLVVTGASASDPGRTREILGTLIRELIRTGIIKGNYSQ
jgi:hypothetical protein